MDDSPEVAIKIHHQHYWKEGLREKAIIDRIKAEGVPTYRFGEVKDAFAFGDHACLVYNFLGKSLEDWIQDGPLKLDEVKAIATQVLEFLVPLHRFGAAHSDLKPENLLYDPVKGSCWVIDLGNAERRFKRGTPLASREYTPPEVILGNDLDPVIDIWSLGCTLFELLTGQLLFDPNESASQKYQEFEDDDEEDNNDEDDESEGDDAEEEKTVSSDSAEITGGMVLHGKYRLVSALGEGNFAVVWKAERLHDRPLTSPDAALTALSIAPPKAAETYGASRLEIRSNLKRFGVTDAFDLALNYEHLLLMQQVIGGWDDNWAKGGVFSRVFCTIGGKLKNDPEVQRVSNRSIESRLIASGIEASEAGLAADLLERMLQLRPDRRATAQDCSAHPWLT